MTKNAEAYDGPNNPELPFEVPGAWTSDITEVGEVDLFPERTAFFREMAERAAEFVNEEIAAYAPTRGLGDLYNAVKDAVEVGKIVLDFRTNLFDILENALNNDVPPFKRLGEAVDQFREDAEGFLDGKVQGLFEQIGWSATEVGSYVFVGQPIDIETYGTFGTIGRDAIFAGSGNNYVYGDDGDDILSGGDGNDTIEGGSGNDAVHGGSGTDKLWGDTGYNRFDFYVGSEKDKFMDIAKADLIVIDDDLAKNFRDIKKAAVQTKKGVVVDFGKDELHFPGVAKKQLKLIDFYYADFEL